jgi:hypothetical protein
MQGWVVRLHVGRSKISPLRGVLIEGAVPHTGRTI